MLQGIGARRAGAAVLQMLVQSFCSVPAAVAQQYQPPACSTPAMAPKMSAKRRAEILKATKAFEGQSLLRAVLGQLQNNPEQASRVLAMLEPLAQVSQGPYSRRDQKCNSKAAGLQLFCLGAELEAAATCALRCCFHALCTHFATRPMWHQCARTSPGHCRLCRQSSIRGSASVRRAAP